MESHPIPQNVTTFQFKLVGEMTLKQFIYLAIGMVIAYLNFVFLASRLPYLAWPVIVISALSGMAFAFLPIAERPLDYWLGAFLKAVYSPTTGVWNKNGRSYQDDPMFSQRITLLGSLTKTTATTPAQAASPVVTEQLRSAPAELTPQPQPALQQPAFVTAIPTTAELEQTVTLAKQAQTIQTQIIDTQRQLSQIKSSNPNTDNEQTSTQINQILTNLQRLIGEASLVKQQLNTLTHTPTQPRVKTKVQTVVSAPPRQTQIILTTSPNVINGFVKDATGDYLSGAVVVIHDKQGLPVRALKTNKLGQFSGATPLPNGIYTVQFEKENLAFDVLQMELNGGVLPALVVSAKKMV